MRISIATSFFLVFVANCASGQDALTAAPKNYRFAYENPFVRVIRVTYAPHETIPVHNHPDTPTVYVYLTDSGPIRFTHVEKPAFTLFRPPVKAGTFRISPGRLEKHEVENPNDIASEFLRIELKTLPLGFQRSSFRSVRDFDRDRRGITTEFTGPRIAIRRVIATGTVTTEIDGSTEPSLLVALSPSLILGAGFSNGVSMQLGEVLWIPPNVISRVRTVGDNGIADLLLIAFR